MKKEYIKINSNCDGLPLGAAIYQPEADDRNRSGPSSAENAIDEDCIKGVVQFSHGMAEHKERYYPGRQWIRFCNKRSQRTWRKRKIERRSWIFLRRYFRLCSGGYPPDNDRTEKKISGKAGVSIRAQHGFSDSPKIHKKV